MIKPFVPYTLLALLCLAFAYSFFMPMDLFEEPGVWKLRILEPEFGYDVFDELMDIERPLNYVLMTLAVLPNLFFVLGAVLLIMKRYRVGLKLSAVMVGLMLVFALLGFSSFGAYTLWLSSGIGVLVLHYYMNKAQNGQRIERFMRTWPMRFIHVIIALNVLLFVYGFIMMRVDEMP